MGGLLLATAFALESATAGPSSGRPRQRPPCPSGQGLARRLRRRLGSLGGLCLCLRRNGRPRRLGRVEGGLEALSAPARLLQPAQPLRLFRAASASCRSTRRSCLRVLRPPCLPVLRLGNRPGRWSLGGPEVPVSGFTPVASGLACFDLRARRLAIESISPLSSRRQCTLDSGSPATSGRNSATELGCRTYGAPGPEPTCCEARRVPRRCPGAEACSRAVSLAVGPERSAARAAGASE